MEYGRLIKVGDRREGAAELYVVAEPTRSLPRSSFGATSPTRPAVLKTSGRSLPLSWPPSTYRRGNSAAHNGGAPPTERAPKPETLMLPRRYKCEPEALPVMSVNVSKASPLDPVVPRGGRSRQWNRRVINPSIRQSSYRAEQCSADLNRPWIPQVPAQALVPLCLLGASSLTSGGRSDRHHVW
jgi:hypothetical protein